MSDVTMQRFMDVLGRFLPNATIGDDMDGQVIIYTNLELVGPHTDPTIPEGEFHLIDMDEIAEPVTCDNCPARSESGWGDTGLCLDCEDPKNICKTHNRTFVGACPLDH